MIDRRNPDFKNPPASNTRASLIHQATDDKPLITVITPLGENTQALSQTLRSLSRQTLCAWEWIVIPDIEVTDERTNEFEQLRKSDARILELFAGPGAASTKYVCLVEAGSQLEPTALECALWMLESEPQVDIVSSYHVTDSSFVSDEDENWLPRWALIRRAQFETGGGIETAEPGTLNFELFWNAAKEAGYRSCCIPEQLAWVCEKPNEKAIPAIEHLKIEADAPNPLPPDQNPFAYALKKERPHVMLVLPWVTMGGADKFNLDVVKQARRLGWDATVVCTEPEDDKWLSLFAAEAPDLFMLHSFIKRVNHPRFLKYLIESRQPDVVLISHSEMGYALLPFLRHHCPDPVYVDYCHIVSPYWINFPAYGAAWQEMLDLNIVSSNQLKGWQTQNGGRAEKIEVAYTNVDTSVWKPQPQLRTSTRNELGLDEQTSMLLYPCRLSHDKQPNVFAGVVHKLKAQGLNFKAFVAGDGPERPWLEEFISENNLSANVELLGTVPNKRMESLLQAADIFFLPSMNEGISLALYEAMASGVAVVTGDVGGQKELVPADCGFLIQRGDEKEEVERYTQAVSELIRDLQKCKTFGENGHKRIKTHFELDLMGERMIELFGHAKKMRASNPQPQIPADYASESAQQALEYARLGREIVHHIESAQAIAAEVERHPEKLEKLQAPYQEHAAAVQVLEPKKNAFMDTLLRFKERVSFQLNTQQPSGSTKTQALTNTSLQNS